jgi:hypothetical protein
MIDGDDPSILEADLKKDDLKGKNRKEIIEALAKDEEAKASSKNVGDQGKESETKDPAVPGWKVQHPEWVWDRLCPACGSLMAMESPRVYNEEVYECISRSCRRQVKLLVEYDPRGRIIRETIDTNHH